MTHLLFVDDILIFSNGSRREVDKLKIMFALFAYGSGIVFDVAKSSMSFMNMSQ